ncbi:MAG: hypothetical protein JTT11_09080 [Candidatus Brockarchaeota archaeon]|nr:hypothetical protein [Candidatus Brockarchaeota archaeon]
MASGYCLKCRKQVEVKDAAEQVLKSGRKALVGACPQCGTKIVKFIKS